MNTNARGSARDPVPIAIYVVTTVVIAGLLLPAAAGRSWAQQGSSVGPDTVRIDSAAAESASVDSAGVDSVDADSVGVDPVAADSAAVDSVTVDSAAAASGGRDRSTSSVLDTLSRDVLERAVRAYAAVGRLRGAYRDRYGAGTASAEADTTYEAFRREAEREIRESGLPVLTYRRLLQSANEDSLLRRVLTMAVRSGADSLTVSPDSLLQGAGPGGTVPESDSTTAPASEPGVTPAPSDSTSPSEPIEP